MIQFVNRVIILLVILFTYEKAFAQISLDPNLSPNSSEIDDYKNKRKNIVFDPIEKKWVEVVEMPQNEKFSVGDSAWTYNPIIKKWEKINVNNVISSNQDLYDGSFWNDFGISINIGLGGSYLRNTIYGLAISNYDNSILLQNSQDIENNRGYKLNWINGDYELIKNLIDSKFGKKSNIKDSKRSYFYNYNINWHFGLSCDYNFAENYIIELGLLCDATIIDVLEPSRDLSEKFSSIKNVTKEKLFIWNSSINLSFGYIVLETEFSDLIGKIGMGPSFLMGNDLFSLYVLAWGLNIRPSVAWAYHVNGYFTITPELYYTYSYIKDFPDEAIWKDTSYIKISSHQLGINLGFRINFAENIEFR